MYRITLIIQILAVLICFISIVILLYQKNTKQSRILLLTIICALLQNYGYLMEMRSTCLEEAMMALRIEYVGAAYITLFLMAFNLEFSNVKFSRVISWIWFFFASIVLFSVITYKDNHFYYSSVTFVSTGLFPHVVLGKGILYIANALLVYSSLIVSMCVSLRSFLRVEDRRMKYNYLLLVFASGIPMAGHLIGIIGHQNEFDVVPAGVAVGVTIFSYAIIKRRLFDIVEVAHENILTTIEDAIIIVDSALRFLEANDAAIKLFPELENGVPGCKLDNRLLAQVLSEKRDCQMVLKSRYYNVHVNEVMRNGNLGGYIALFFDVTKTVRQMQQMRLWKEKADRANRAKSLFLANMSHEIRTPLNAILGFDEVILRDYQDPMVQEYGKNIQDSAGALLAIVNDILDFSKIEADKIEIHEEPYQIKHMLQELESMFHIKAEEKKLSFSMEVSEQLPSWLIGDDVRVRQIATNLISNAVKYTSEGSVIVKVVWEEDNDISKMTISVTDTGIGIKEKEISHLFTSFERLDENRNRSIEGTGLGLNITKRLVELMNGELLVQSEYGKGSVFTAIIPQRVPDNRIEAPKTESLQEETCFQAPDAKVLLVDDSKTNLMVEQALLKSTKVQVKTALSGEECLEMIIEEHFDLIFLDHRMPVMDGAETLKKMKSIEHMCKGTPVIVLTANAVNNARGNYLKMGFDDFLAKPVKGTDLINMLQKYLEPIG